MRFGFTLKPDQPIERVVALTRRAEGAGFDYGWIFDSHVIWREPYPLLTLMALNSDRLRLGTCVTNPGTRDVTVTASVLATLNEISGGRMDLGIGRGDSARRVMGKRPLTVERMEEACHIIRGLTAGEAVVVDGQEMRMPWAQFGPVPVWVAGYGPKALSAAGRVADGIIIQLADPNLVRWCVSFARRAAEEAGRDPNALQVMAAAPAYVSDDVALAREKVRWFPALVSNHVVDLIDRYPADQLPPELTGYVRDREGYDYLHHAEVGSSNSRFVPDDIADRFGIIGPVEAHRERLAELTDAGVTQFNIYLMNGEEEETLDVYGREVIPAVAAVAG